MPNSQFQELLASATGGSEEAAWALTERYTPHLVRIVRLRLSRTMRQHFDSIDFVQQVWSSLFLSEKPLREFGSEQELMRHLVARVRHKVIDASRAMTTAKRDVRRNVAFHMTGDDDEDAAPEPHSQPGTGSQVFVAREKWCRVMDGKPERVQKIVKLRLAGNSNAEIAEQCGVTPRTVLRSLDSVREEFLG
ncbi:MAG: sigma-70 family RNA polymerase sigma factor [Planctomycetota bacterium]